MPSLDNLFNLTGKVAVVTGGSGALGSLMAQGLARAGARVAVMSRQAERAAPVVEEVEQAGGTALALAADVLDRASLEAAKATVLDAWGRLDILVNAAGGNVPEATLKPDGSFFDLPEAAFRKVFDLNLIGTLLPTQVFGPAMAEAGQGVIVNVSSMASDRAITRVAGYSAAKAAVDNFTRWLAVELAKKYDGAIRVNAFAPGFFIGEQNRRLLLNEDDTLTPRGRQIIDLTPMGRFGEAEELVGTLVWLCSDASKFVTGVVVPVDGGFSAFSGV